MPGTTAILKSAQQNVHNSLQKAGSSSLFHTHPLAVSVWLQ